MPKPPSNRSHRPLRSIAPQVLLDRYKAGESAAQIAYALGTTRQAVSYKLIKHKGTEWRNAILDRAVQHIRDAQRNTKFDDTYTRRRTRRLARRSQVMLPGIARRALGHVPPWVEELVNLPLP